jgi:transcriptional regulator of acetoin/glycerol metabolism
MHHDNKTDMGLASKTISIFDEKELVKQKTMNEINFLARTRKSNIKSSPDSELLDEESLESSDLTDSDYSQPPVVKTSKKNVISVPTS